MTALTDDRKTDERIPNRRSFGLNADAVIFQGSMVALDAQGFLNPVTAISTLTIVGRAVETINNTGGNDGDVTTEVDVGHVFKWENESGDELLLTDIGALCYGLDDQTVGKTAGARSVAGVVFQVDSDGVWVDHNRKSI